MGDPLGKLRSLKILTDACREPLRIPRLISRNDAHAAILSDVVVFDGTCGFCTWSIAAFTMRIASGSRVVPSQWLSDVRLAEIGTTREQCAREVHYVDAGGQTYRGADAVNAVLARTPLIGGLTRFVARRPALLAFERACYAWIAAHRVGISRALGTQRCALIPERAM